MPEFGFFSPSKLIGKTQQPSLVPRCGECRLFENCQSPKMPVSGEGKRRILIVGEAAGENEDSTGVQFVGDSGQYLREALEKFGIEPNRDCWFTNSVICRPSNSNGSNRTPTKNEIDWCRPTVLRSIKELDPDVIIPLGLVAVKSVIGTYWNVGNDTMTKWAGWQVPNHKPNVWICPSYHPSHCIRIEEGQKDNQLLDLLFDKYLSAALKLKGKPWKEVPNWKKEIIRILDDKEAAKIIRKLTENGKAVAFDYETNMLKPDSSDAKIVSCAISDGETTVAYPWYGEAVTATVELLRSTLPKMAHHAKFEQRWTKSKCGIRVKNPIFCSMIAAHILDNRRGICSLKFQAYARLGQVEYNRHIEPFFHADGSNKLNRINEVDLDDLLLYNGMDALLEYKLAMIQAKELGVIL